MSAPLRRLLPEPGSTTVAELLSGYRPWEDPPDERHRTETAYQSEGQKRPHQR